MFHNNMEKKNINRRRFSSKIMAGVSFITLPKLALSAVKKLNKPVKLGLIADLHHDVMHDGAKRLNSFVSSSIRRAINAVN